MSFEAILFIAVLVIASKLGGEILHRIGQPTILGNVIAGIIVGPALLAIVQPIEAIELFVSIGVFFLFFLIGLEEIDIAGLFKVMKGKIFAGSAVAFLIPFLVAGLFGMAIDMDFVKAFAIASVIAASSLGVTAKILSDLGKLKSTIHQYIKDWSKNNWQLKVEMKNFKKYAEGKLRTHREIALPPP